MKKLGIIILFTAGLAVNTFGQLSTGLKAEYSFGGSANDISGQNHHGTVVGTATLTTDRFNTINCAYQFPGDTSVYIKVNYNTDFNISPTGALSISLWYQGGTSSTMDLEILFGKVCSTNWPNNDFYLGLYDMNNPAFGNMYSAAMPFGTPSIPDPNWHHAVGVYNDKKWYLYQDNSLVASEVTQTYTITQSTGFITIGKGFEGKIDDIRFYNRALNATEVGQIYALPGSCTMAGLHELSEPELKVYPNPTTDIITIDLDGYTGPTTISVFDINGKRVINELSNEKSAKIDLTKYDSGMYLLNITNDHYNKKTLLIKQNQ